MVFHLSDRDFSLMALWFPIFLLHPLCYCSCQSSEFSNRCEQPLVTWIVSKFHIFNLCYVRRKIWVESMHLQFTFCHLEFKAPPVSPWRPSFYVAYFSTGMSCNVISSMCILPSSKVPKSNSWSEQLVESDVLHESSPILCFSWSLSVISMIWPFLVIFSILKPSLVYLRHIMDDMVCSPLWAVICDAEWP